MLSKANFTAAQDDFITHMYENEYSIGALPMGFGKTACSLTAADELMADGVISRVLVVAPARVRDLQWRGEHLKWDHLQDLDVQFWPEFGQVTVVSFNQLAKAIKQIDFSEGWGLIIDELTKLKQPGGAWFKALRPHVKKFSWRVGLTGTLAEEGLDKLYSMVMSVDAGATFGRNKDNFLREYFTPIDYNEYKWEPKEGSREKIAAMIKPFTFQHSPDDQDLPPLNIHWLNVTMPNQTKHAYATMCREMALENENVTAVNAAVLTGKLQQLCAGFMYDEDKVPVVFDRTKEAALRKLVDPVEQTMIVYRYKYELEWLTALYPKAGVLGSNVTESEAQVTIDAWNDGRLNVLLVHPLSAGHGLNCQYGGNHIIFLGPIWSRDQTDQVIARIRRRGCEHDSVEVTILAAEESVEDIVIAPRLQHKQDDASVFAAYLDGFR